MLQLYTGKAPFPQFTDHQVAFRVVKGIRPPRPNLPNGDPVSDPLWLLITSCWIPKAPERPGAREVANRMTVQRMEDVFQGASRIRDSYIEATQTPTSRTGSTPSSEGEATSSRLNPRPLPPTPPTNTGRGNSEDAREGQNSKGPAPGLHRDLDDFELDPKMG